MQTLCASGTALEIVGDASGNLSLRDTKGGVTIKFSRAESNGAVNFLSDEMKKADNSGIRECMKGQIDKIINFILGEAGSGTGDIQFVELGVPPLQTEVLKIAESYPSGSWKSDPVQGSYFEYKSDFDGLELIARYHRTGPDPAKFGRVSLRFDASHSWSSGKYGDRSSGSSDQVQKACSVSFDKFVGIVIKYLGPPIDRPVVTKHDALDAIKTCQGRGSSVRCIPSGSINNHTLSFQKAPIRGSLTRTTKSQGVDGQVTYEHRAECEVVLLINRA